MNFIQLLYRSLRAKVLLNKPQWYKQAFCDFTSSLSVRAFVLLLQVLVMLGTSFQLQPELPATGPLHTGLLLPSVPGPQILYGLVDYPKDESIALNIWPRMNVHVKQHDLGNIVRAWGELGSGLSPSLVSCITGPERPESPHSWHESTVQHAHHSFCLWVWVLSPFCG